MRETGLRGLVLAAGKEKLVPAAVVGRLLAGEDPVNVRRERRGFPKSGLARSSGVNRVVVADIEAGRKGGSVGSVKVPAVALGWGSTIWSRSSKSTDERLKIE